MPSLVRSRWPLWQTLVLVWALLWAPLWGQWHEQTHRLGQALGVSVSQLGMPGDADLAQTDSVDHAAGSALCHVLDHLAHADRLIAVALALPSVMAPMPVPWLRPALAWGHDRWLAAQARAPPALI